MDPLQYGAQALQRNDQPRLAARVASQRYRVGLARTAATWSDVVSHVDKVDPGVLSVDIFDTVLHRSLMGDHNVEMAVCDAVVGAGLWPGSSASLLAARHDARANQPGGNANDWFTEAGVDNPGAALSIEADVECRLAQPIPGMVDGLNAVRASGVKVCFTSDMHLPSSVIRQILSAVGACHEADSLIVSCDAGATKADGGLFAVVQDRFRGQRVLHVGNNRWSDGAQPIGYGIDSIYFPLANPTRYEHAFAEQGIAGGLVAGAARHVRLHTDASAVVDVGTGVLGQAMVAFSLWIQTACAADGITQIAFCARDGEVPHLVTAVLESKTADPLTLRYLHGNRHSLLLSGAETLGYDDWLAIGFATPGSGIRSMLDRTSLAKTLQRLGLSADAITNDNGLDRFPLDTPLGGHNHKALRKFLETPQVRARVLDQSQRSLDDHIDYLRGLGIERGQWAVVDIGWRGESAAALSAILERQTGYRPLTMHFGGNGTDPVVERHLNAKRFAFDGEARPVPSPGITDAVELLTGTGKERLERFDRLDDGTVRPAMKPTNPDIATPKRATLHLAAIEVATRLIQLPIDVRSYLIKSDTLGDTSATVFNMFWTNPTRDEAEALGGMFYERDGKGQSIVPIASPFRIQDLQPNDTVRLWGQASRLLSSPVMKLAVATRSMLRHARTSRSDRR